MFIGLSLELISSPLLLAGEKKFDVFASQEGFKEGLRSSVSSMSVFEPLFFSLSRTFFFTGVVRPAPHCELRQTSSVLSKEEPRGVR